MDEARRHFERLELYDTIGFRELNPDGFDRYVFPDYEVRLGKGAQAFRDKLVADFPQETRGIDKFFALLAEMSQTIRKVTKLRDLRSALRLAQQLTLRRVRMRDCGHQQKQQHDGRAHYFVYSNSSRMDPSSR